MKIRTSRGSRNVVLEMESKDSTLPPIPVAELLLKRILVPVDFSDCSYKALHYGVQFARQFNAELMLLHVIVLIPPSSPMVMLESEQLSAGYREESAKRLSELRREITEGLAVKAVTRDGAAAHQGILDAARETNCDLIVIGNHGRTGLSRMLLGGTAERVVRHAPCPVLVIREREHDFIFEQKTIKR